MNSRFLTSMIFLGLYISASAQNVGIGTTNPSAKLHVKGDGTTINAIQVTNDKDEILDSCLVLSPSGKVGIGTENPNFNLDVISKGTTGAAGIISLTAPNIVSSNITAITQGKESSYANQAEWRFLYQGQNSLMNAHQLGFNDIQPVVTFRADGKAGFGTLEPTNTLSVQGIADFSDNVGIGTNVPSNKLSVVGNANITGNVGIGTASPSVKLDVVGNIRIQDGTEAQAKVLTSNAFGVATWQYLPLSVGISPGNTPYWNGSTWVNNSSNIFNNGGKVGIGTTTPTGKFTVAGNVHIYGSAGLTDSFGIGTLAPAAKLHLKTGKFICDDIVQEFRTNGIPKWTINGNNTSYSISRDATNSDFFIKGFNGDIGIGTATPLGELHVKSSAALPNAIDQQQTQSTAGIGGTTSWQSFTAGISGLLTQVDLRVNSPIINANAPGTIRIYEGEGTSGTLLSTTSVTYMQFNGFQSFPLSTHVYVTSGNQYTIEFITPSANLPWISINNNNPYAGGISDYSPGVDYLFKTYVTPLVEGDALLVTNGKVGIGTTSPSNKFSVAGSADFMDSVGIGTTVPMAKLDIAGNIKITDGSEGLGKILTSNANGLASWAVHSGLTRNGTSPGNTPYWNGTIWVANSSTIFNNGSNVGIGTNTPDSQAKLHIKNGSLTIDDNTLRFFVNGNPKWDIAGGNGSYEISRSGTAVDFYISGTNGNVGLGTSTPGAHKLHVVGTAALSTGTSWTSTSDIRLKENIHPYKRGLSEILKIKPVYYSYTEASGLKNDEKLGQNIGIIAQELETIIPEAIMTAPVTLKDGSVLEDAKQLVKADAIWFAFVNAFQEQQEQIEKQQAQINQLIKDYQYLITKYEQKQLQIEVKMASLEANMAKESKSSNREKQIEK